MAGRTYDLAGLAYDKAGVLYDTGGLTVPSGAAVRPTRVRRPRRTGFQEVGEATGRPTHLPIIAQRGPVAIGRRLEQTAPLRRMRRISLRMAAPLAVTKGQGCVQRGTPAELQRRGAVTSTKVEQRFNLATEAEFDAWVERELWKQALGGFLD
jgi:hypothetical protein